MANKSPYQQPLNDLYAAYHSSREGLSTAQANQNREQFGKNQLAQKKKKPVWMIFLEQFKDFLVIILIIAAIISAITGELESTIVILVVITMNAILGTVQTVKAEKSLDNLKSLSAPHAKVLRDGTTVLLPAAELVVGDVILLEAGDQVPADARILEAASLQTNESALTGESTNVEKECCEIPQEVPLGDRKNMVYSGGFVTYGRGVCLVTNVGMETEVGKIAALMQNASERRTPLQRTLDQFGQKLSIAILIISAIVFLLELFRVDVLNFDSIMNALMFAIALAVAAIPEALSSIVTIVLSFGTQKMAKEHAIMRKLQAVEGLGSVSVICSDKTGTLTEGVPTVMDVLPEEGVSAETLLSVAYALEQPSEHPLAAAIVTYCKQQNIPLQPAEQFAQTAGQGVSGICNGMHCFGGNQKMMEVHHLSLPSTEKQEAFAKAGKTPLYFAADGKLLGTLTAADPIRQTSRTAVAEFQRMGLDVILLTGDNRLTAEAIAQQAGITHVIADVLPQDKAMQVKQLQADGKKTAMIGDGINDAPALTQADVGIAIGAGTDAAIDSADIVLMRNDLQDAVTAIQLSRATIRNIKENLFWAFIYNLIGIPIAAGVFYPIFGWEMNPMIGAAAMSFSSVFVVSNALRLRRFRPFGKSANKKADTTPVANGEIVIQIKGMMCEHCVAAVTKALQSVSGVTEMRVVLSENRAYCKGTPTDAELRTAIQNAGYQVKKIIR